MKIINVVELKFGIVNNINSFIISNEKLSKNIIKKAEDYFIEIAREMGYTESEYEIDDLLNDGYYEKEGDPEMSCVCLCWSNIEI